MLAELKTDGLLPCLVITGIKMPVLNGLDTLAHIRRYPEFGHLPVVMFTTSSNSKDREYAAGVTPT